MAVYNIPYDRQTDPKALFARGFENMLGGIMQGRQSRRLGEALSSMDTNATPIEVAMKLLSERVSPQIAMGMGGLQQRGQFGPSQMMALERWNKYQQAVASGDTDTANRLLSSALVNFNVPTSRELWPPKGRAEVAEVELQDKVGMSSTERANAKKGIEELFESTPDNAWAYGWSDYSREKMIGVYKQWLTEQDYGSKTPRQRKSLDEIWDGKMSLMNKTGFKFKDKDRPRLSKNEIDWDPTDPEVRKLRGVVSSPTGTQTNNFPEQGYMLSEGVTEKIKEINATENRLVRQGAMNEPQFEMNEKTGEARKVFDEQGEEVGIRLKNGQTFKVGSTMKRGGVTYKYIGDNQWQIL